MGPHLLWNRWGLNFEHYRVVPATAGYNNPQVQISWRSSVSQSRVTIAQYCLFVCLVDFILYIPSTIFQLNRDRSSWVEPVLSWDKCVLLKDQNAVTPMRLEPAASRSRVKHSTTALPLNTVNSEIFVRVLFLHMESFVKTKSSRNGEITAVY